MNFDLIRRSHPERPLAYQFALSSLSGALALAAAWGTRKLLSNHWVEAQAARQDCAPGPLPPRVEDVALPAAETIPEA